MLNYVISVYGLSGAKIRVPRSISGARGGIYFADKYFSLPRHYSGVLASGRYKLFNALYRAMDLRRLRMIATGRVKTNGFNRSRARSRPYVPKYKQKYIDGLKMKERVIKTRANSHIYISHRAINDAQHYRMASLRKSGYRRVYSTDSNGVGTGIFIDTTDGISMNKEL